MSLETKNTNRYIYILGSEGDLRETVPEGTEGAIKRAYESSDGKKGEKYELVYKSIEGVITKVDFFDSDYGTNLQITFEFNDGENVTLSMNTNTPYSEDMMKKLPNVDFNAPLKLSPYNFTDDKGKNRRGVSIVQNDEKVKNFFSDGEKAINGMPEPKGDVSKYNADKWKLYFGEVRVFLVDYINDNIVPQFASEASQEKTTDEEF